MKQVYLVRHALSDMNVAGLFSGHTDAQLTEEGLDQAKKTGQEIKKAGLKFDLIICSPLSRTYKTAKVIAEQIGYPVEKIEKQQILIERNFGELEGTKGTDFWADNSYESIDEVSGAETVQQMGTRAKKALKEIDGLKADSILVVTHGAIGRAMRREVINMPHHHEYDDNHRAEYQIPNAGLIRLI